MRKPVMFALVAVIVLLAGATSVLYMRYQKTSADYASTRAEQEKTQARYDQTIQAVAEIQDSLNAISFGESSVQMRSGDLQAEQRLSGPNGREALDRIAVLRATILRSKARIQQLESSMKANGTKIAGLAKMIKNLKSTVSEKEGLIAQLSGRVDSLQTEVTGLATTVQETQDTLRVRDQTLEDRRRELATVYYIVGKKKELRNAGVVVAKGGVLGLGKTLQPLGSPNETAFTPLDTDQETVVRVSAAKAKVLSAQPASSYELKLVDGQVELHIVNATEFRKVKQLVILTG